MQAETRLISGADRARRETQLGRPKVLARRVANPLRRVRERLVYPRVARLADESPALYRLYSESLSRRITEDIDPEETRVIPTGSQGSEEARSARDHWQKASEDQ